ncbi:MAG: UvrB/UvrC motif-containing protein [Candidatus Omnitrophica bacterium]|nr:UvrB/UvrC motif-containing protein [Candidatus Omnitrophota bacterium]MCM8826035.1 UvrB/UvrC motif-containing protein [Candidatus Omnitrophota bacterium]
MLCDICHKKIATVHLTEIVEGKVMELHICQDCAKNKAEELKQQLNISDFLGGLTLEGEDNKSMSIKCSFCGTTFYDFKKKGRLGCAKCYTHFKSQLLPLIKKIHGSNEHKGKLPKKVEEKVIVDRNLKILKERLERAVKLEAYEDAAKLRDEIRELEKKVRKED